MHSLVNHIPIASDADWDEIARLFDGFATTIRPDHPEVLVVQLVRTGEDAATMIATFRDEAAMKTFSSEVAGPWFGENLRRFLSGPADRRTGEVIAGYCNAS